MQDIATVETFLQNNGNNLQKLLTFLEKTGKKCIIVEPGFSFVKPRVYFDIGSIKRKRGKESVISYCKCERRDKDTDMMRQEVIYVVHL